ncbi:MAG TPA: DCC1-like thiol-disulfide oxidoreductase family protein [Rhodopila sp.]|jgi:predicted DCC family thiol-disulfide oxidoreductase YuxK|nr:DCC1-like thiol-disulfide oxidoreductase family protein [Rhodopila sp.]
MEETPTLTASPLEPDVADGTVLFDGVCVLCSGWFRFVAARDKAVRFRFTPIQSAYGRSLAIRLGIDPDHPETNAVIIGGVVYLRSDSAIQILRCLPGWSWSAALLAIPRVLRDSVYSVVARNRYRLFGRTETCMIPDADLARHILHDE